MFYLFIQSSWCSTSGRWNTLRPRWANVVLKQKVYISLDYCKIIAWDNSLSLPYSWMFLSCSIASVHIPSFPLSSVLQQKPCCSSYIFSVLELYLIRQLMGFWLEHIRCYCANILGCCLTTSYFKLNETNCIFRKQNHSQNI